ncbi:hypothetical protein AWC38_SpisGene24257, partial [Stylophora pistillata]
IKCGHKDSFVNSWVALGGLDGLDGRVLIVLYSAPEKKPANVTVSTKTGLTDGSQASKTARVNNYGNNSFRATFRYSERKGVNDVYYDTVKPKIIRKSLRPTLKNSVNGKEGGNKGLQAAQEHSEYAMLDTSRMQENRAPVYTALRKSTSADGQMKKMEVEFKTYHKMSTLSQDSTMRPNYENIGFV